MYIIRIRFRCDSFDISARCRCGETMISDNPYVILCNKCGRTNRLTEKKFSTIPIFMLIKEYTKKKK